METINFFDSWLDTQNKIINNWVSTTQKMQNAIAGGQAMEKGSEIYNEWLKNQADIVKGAGEAAGDAAKESSNNADFFSKWMSSQKEITLKWMNYNQEVINNFVNAGGNANSSNAWMEAYNTWVKNFNNPFSKMMEGLNGFSTKDAFGNILNTSNSYFKMYEIWMPIYKAMSENGFDKSKFSELFSADKFKQVMDNTFQYMYPAPVKDAFENAGQWLETLNSFSKQFTGQYFNQLKDMPKVLPNMMFGDNEAVMTAYNNMQNFYQRNVFPIFKLAAPGKESEFTQLYINTVDKYAVYATKLNELQYVMYVTGQKILEEMMTESYTELSNGAEPVPYNEFFQKWVERSEKGFLDLFKTEEYSKLQGEIVDLGIEVKGGFEKVMETVFSQYPVVLRSEADELHKTIYDLKKKVRALESQLNGETSEIADEKKAAKKTARTTR